MLNAAETARRLGLKMIATSASLDKNPQSICRNLNFRLPREGRRDGKAACAVPFVGRFSVRMAKHQCIRGQCWIDPASRQTPWVSIRGKSQLHRSKIKPVSLLRLDDLSPIVATLVRSGRLPFAELTC
jgi:hypothetical protein